MLEQNFPYWAPVGGLPMIPDEPVYAARLAPLLPPTARGVRNIFWQMGPNGPEPASGNQQQQPMSFGGQWAPLVIVGGLALLFFAFADKGKKGH